MKQFRFLFVTALFFISCGAMDNQQAVPADATMADDSITHIDSQAVQQDEVQATQETVTDDSQEALVEDKDPKDDDAITVGDQQATLIITAFPSGGVIIQPNDGWTKVMEIRLTNMGDEPVIISQLELKSVSDFFLADYRFADNAWSHMRYWVGGSWDGFKPGDCLKQDNNTFVLDGPLEIESHTPTSIRTIVFEGLSNELQPRTGSCLVIDQERIIASTVDGTMVKVRLNNESNSERTHITSQPFTMARGRPEFRKLEDSPVGAVVGMARQKVLRFQISNTGVGTIWIENLRLYVQGSVLTKLSGDPAIVLYNEEDAWYADAHRYEDPRSVVIRTSNDLFFNDRYRQTSVYFHNLGVSINPGESKNFQVQMDTGGAVTGDYLEVWLLGAGFSDTMGNQSVRVLTPSSGLPLERSTFIYE